MGKIAIKYLILLIFSTGFLSGCSRSKSGSNNVPRRTSAPGPVAMSGEEQNQDQDQTQDQDQDQTQDQNQGQDTDQELVRQEDNQVAKNEAQGEQRDEQKNKDSNESAEESSGEESGQKKSKSVKSSAGLLEIQKEPVLGVRRGESDTVVHIKTRTGAPSVVGTSEEKPCNCTQNDLAKSQPVPKPAVAETKIKPGQSLKTSTPVEPQVTLRPGTAPAGTSTSNSAATGAASLTDRADVPNQQHRSERTPLHVEMYFANDLVNDKAIRKQVAGLIKKADLEKANRAEIVDGDVYNSWFISKNKRPYATKELFELVRGNKACDINTAGACVVYERDLAFGKTAESVYVIAGAPAGDTPLEYRLVRMDISVKKPLLLDGRGAGIFVVSQLPSPEVAAQQSAEAVDPNFISKNPDQAVNPNRIEPVTDPELNNQINQEYQKIAKETKTSVLPNFYACWITAELRQVKGFAIFSRLKKAETADGSVAYTPTKTSAGIDLPGDKAHWKNFLNCHLVGSTTANQHVHIQVNDYQKFRVGWAFPTTKQRLIASGGGWANGAIDILNIREFDYALQAAAVAGVGLNITPIIISNRSDMKPVFSGQISAVWWGLNVDVTLAGWYEITIDPNDT